MTKSRHCRVGKGAAFNRHFAFRQSMLLHRPIRLQMHGAVWGRSCECPACRDVPFHGNSSRYRTRVVLRVSEAWQRSASAVRRCQKPQKIDSRKFAWYRLDKAGRIVKSRIVGLMENSIISAEKGSRCSTEKGRASQLEVWRKSIYERFMLSSDPLF